MTTTDHLQVLPDFYITDNSPVREYVNTNPRYKRFNQIHFTAGDEQQFLMYLDYSNDSIKKIKLPTIKNWVVPNIEWNGYVNLEKKYIYNLAGVMKLLNFTVKKV